MKNEGSRKKEAENRLSEEERTQRLQYGGQEMRAELAMEENEIRLKGQNVGREGSSFEQGLTPEEQQSQRRMAEGELPYPGYGEDQKAQLAMWGRDYRVAQEIREDWKGQQQQSGFPTQKEPPRAPPYQEEMSREYMMRSGSKQVQYPPGSGTYYSETWERPTGGAAPESYFGEGAGRPMERREMPREEMKSEQYLKYPSGTGSYYSESRERPVEGASPESYFGAGLERISRQMMAVAEDMSAMSRDPRFRAGTGSYYSGSRERPVETAATEAYFGAGTGRPMKRREMSQDEMRAEQALRYPSGTGSYYSESRERPVEDASPQAYVRSIQPAAQMAMPAERETQPQGMMGTVQETGQQAVTKVKEVGQQISEKMPPQVSQATEKAKASMQQVAENPETIAQPGRSEDIASSSGEVIGSGLRKLANVIAGFTSGFQKGIRANQEQQRERQQVQQPQQQAQETTYQPQQRQQMQEAPQANVVEEKTVRREVKKQ